MQFWESPRYVTLWSLPKQTFVAGSKRLKCHEEELAWRHQCSQLGRSDMVGRPAVGNLVLTLFFWSSRSTSSFQHILYLTFARGLLSWAWSPLHLSKAYVPGALRIILHSLWLLFIVHLGCGAWLFPSFLWRSLNLHLRILRSWSECFELFRLWAVILAILQANPREQGYVLDHIWGPLQRVWT